MFSLHILTVEQPMDFKSNFVALLVKLLSLFSILEKSSVFDKICSSSSTNVNQPELQVAYELQMPATNTFTVPMLGLA